MCKLLTKADRPEQSDEKRGFYVNAIMDRLRFWGEWLARDPIGFLIYLLYFVAAILGTLILHEVAHGYVAYRCGDPTAKMLGRLSLNPLKHLDPIGTAFLVFLGFGWAKPVPVNPRNFQNYRRDDFLVSVAGVTVNLTLFLLSLALAVGLNGLVWKPEFLSYFGAREMLSSEGIGYGLLLGGHGGEVVDWMRYPWMQHVQRFLLLFSTMNLSVAVFNLLPIPPLDGFHIFNDILLKGKLSLNSQAFQFTRMILFVVMISGVLSNILFAVTGAVENGVLNLFLRIAGQA